MDLETAIRVIKAITSYNGEKLEFDKKFLQLFDEVNIEVIEDSKSIIIKTKI